MLVNITRKKLDPMLEMIAKINGNSNSTIELYNGVYQIGHFNFENELSVQLDSNSQYPNLGTIGSYGVCDNYNQILEQCPEINDSQERAFIISLTEIKRATQSPEGGWRWHKWGEYIGTQNPQCEYIYDEEDIECVYVYSVLEVTKHVGQLMPNPPKPIGGQKQIDC
jgi:hypothetical protein